MVKLHVKRGEESVLLFTCTTDVLVRDIILHLVKLYNGILKVQRLCEEIGSLTEHGVMLPPNMIGLTGEQILELKLKDEFEDICVPSGGYVVNTDPVGHRNGRGPNEKMKDVLKRTISDAKASVSKKQVSAGVCVTETVINDAMDKLRGAVTIVYPMNLPPYDIIRQEFEGIEDLSGTQAGLQVLEDGSTQLWWAGKEMVDGKKLMDYIGKNEKTTIVAKLQKKGQGPPAREPVFTEVEKKSMMSYAYRKQEELKKLEADSEDGYLNTEWADPQSLKKTFSGLSNISWKPK